MGKEIILYNLADSVTDEQYKDFVTKEKGPTLESLPSVNKFELVRINGAETGEIPYTYVGIVHLNNLDDFYQKDGIIISITKDHTILDANPETVDRERISIDFEGIALIVKDIYHPCYQYVKAFDGNHTFQITVWDNLTYEYLIAGGWSEGTVIKTAEDFKNYTT